MKKLFLLIVVFTIFSSLAFGEEVHLADAKPHEYAMHIDELPVENMEEVGYFLFEPNSSNSLIHEDLAFIKLNSIASYLMNKHIANGQIHVIGYAASAKTDVDPYDLSRQRALLIINELEARGVPKHWFANPAAYGETNQWGNNKTKIGRNFNRRVTVLIQPMLTQHAEYPLYFSAPTDSKTYGKNLTASKSKIKLIAIIILLIICFLLIAAIILNISKFWRKSRFM